MVAVLSPEELRQLVREAVREELAAARPVPAETEELLTTGQAAKLVGVKPKTVVAWIRTRTLKAGRPGRHYLIARSDLLACARGSHSAVDPRGEASRIAATLRR